MSLLFKRAAAAIAIAGFLGALSPLVARSQNSAAAVKADGRFHIEEATIEDVHRAIKAGDVTCRQIVQAYVSRAKAYNGMCTSLVTKDGSRISPGKGPVRAGSPLTFPSSTVVVSSILPQLDQYKGPPIELGRMEATRSDPQAQQQFGMVVGIPDAGQVNALSTLNLRGERSLTCKAKCDTAPSRGDLPKSCPAACEEFRRQPDALERASELDAKYGRNPDLEQMPMYCVAFSFKDVLDTKDMRTTGGADVAYATDAPPQDATIVAELRAKGAIIYAKANLAEYNGGGGNPGGVKPKSNIVGAGSRSSWAGTACNPYDTARETGGSSSGSAASVGANLVNCSICEETGGSCRQPAWRNGVVGFVTTQGLVPFGGAIGADPYLDRPGIQCRTVRDTALVLDALKDPERGYFDPRYIYSALPNALVSKQPYATFAMATAPAAGAKPLAGMRIGIVREYMVKHAANDGAMSDQINDEIKRVLRDQLGAELVESTDPAYPDDPDIPNMAYDFNAAIAEILPFHMPEFLALQKDNKPEFAVPGFDVTKRDYMVAAAEGRAPLSEKLNLRRINISPPTASFSFQMDQYLMRRGDERVKDWVSLNANSKYYSDERAVAMKNWENKVEIASAGITQRVKMREVMRLVILKVMRQNRLDALVNPTITIPPARIGYASQPVASNRPNGRFPTSADLGIPELTVPAGFNSVIYEPEFGLNEAKDDYTSVANNSQPSTLGNPLPVGISFWAGPGDEPVLLKLASTYEAATKHRQPPKAFGPVRGEP